MIDNHINYGVMGPSGKKLSTLFFILGVIGAFAIRLVLILSHWSIFWSSIAWYVGMVSYLFFYHHRWAVEKERRETLEKYDLLEKFKNESLTTLEKNELFMLLNSVAKSKVRLNIFVWYVITIITLIVALLFDLLEFVK